MEVRSALTALVWLVVAGGLIAGLLPRARMPRPALAAGSALAALAALTALSMAWGHDDGAATVEVVRALGYLGLFALVVCLTPPGSAHGWLAGLALGIAVVGALALGSRLVPALPGSDHEIATVIPAARGRLSYPIGDWNVLAAILGLGVVLLAWLGAEGRSRLDRALALGGVPMLALGIYLTSSRGGVIALAAGIAVLVGLSAKRAQIIAGLVPAAFGAGVLILVAHTRGDLLDGLDTHTAHTQGAEILFATLLVVGSVAAARWLLDERIEGIRVSRDTWRTALVAVGVVGLIAVIAANPVDRFNEFKAPPEEGGELDPGFVASHFSSGSSSGRYQFWSVAFDAFEDQPVHGIGAGGYGAYWAEHAPITRAIRDAHSLYLETLAELGPLGLALVVGFIAVGAAAGVSALRSGRGARPEVVAALAILAAGAISAGIEVIWEIPAAFAPVVVAVALLAGAATRSGEELEAEPAREDFGWGVAVIATGWIAMLFAGGAFLTQRSIAASQDAAGRADYEEAADRARDAIALQPWAEDPRLQLALVYEAAGELAQARIEAANATDRANDDWEAWLARARIEARSGRAAAASAALARARSLNPRAPFLAQPPAP